jgi:hypothetical protein
MTPAEFQTLTGAWPERMADLAVFLERLTEANAVMNLVGPDSIPDFWNRHAWDSAQLLDLAPEAKTWADLGAGAGFPGLVLAILLKGRPGAHVWLIDSLQKRCRFLQTIVDELALPATVIWGRAEEQALRRWTSLQPAPWLRWRSFWVMHSPTSLAVHKLCFSRERRPRRSCRRPARSGIWRQTSPSPAAIRAVVS